MTLTLILTRHAKSDWDDATLTDHARPLNPRGQADAPKIGAWLRLRGHLPDAALVSSARRTLETWARLSPELGRTVPMTVVPELYHADADEILAQLHGAAGRTVMVIGHNPGIGEFAHRIVADPADHPRFVDYPTGATLVATFPGDDWTGVDWWTGRVVDFTVPRDL